jgi:SAM-dependent methyltransferase
MHRRTSTIGRIRPVNDAGRAREFWDREVVARAYTTWLDDPLVREYVVGRVGGWPLDWLERVVSSRLAETRRDPLGAGESRKPAGDPGPSAPPGMTPRQPFGRALSIGCGAGALERDLLARNLCERIDAFDGSLQSVALAKREEPRAGYYIADFNEPALPRAAYDAVFFHQSLHHVAKLEKLLRAVLLSLKADGILYLDEYIGPSSTAWTPRLARAHASAWELVPRQVRKVDELPYPIAPDDPSEAIRSGEILDQLAIGFDVVARQDYGGGVLAAVHPHVDWSAAPPDLLPQLIELDRQAPAYYTLIVARPKRGIGAMRYFIEPKLKRIGRMFR